MQCIPINPEAPVTNTLLILSSINIKFRITFIANKVNINLNHFISLQNNYFCLGLSKDLLNLEADYE
jgi:hypothetical protein